ncbi:26S proteasome non-ATPase regulatory subunit 8 [Strongylocentrotus purpuratus]|uniref:26S proteasome non-ATPase regulatory subunit 8 n=1 Tax=Strongylocentrotus purpuratus TaxID=7668 RepID=A0A7M7RAU0_STRPU|nr:26S proteasome non-ATPase regulatory subunit 8 [Strongylocentrotus purpuratus]|eukprot:XP_783742.2 PREDICTED: 26S proteasome non-ATPase regulatory subunit 8 [Strongylocentrotus purpuratus]
MASLKATVTMYQELNKEWKKKTPDLNKCGEILGKLKIALLKLSFLPTSSSQPSQKELLIAREVLEIGVKWSVSKRDVQSFERYIAQLKPYYFDFRESMPVSPYRYELLGLNLLRLLSQNRLAEFHTELELLPAKDLQSNIYIKHPVSIEQYLMEGSYNKVFLAKGNVPADSYRVFMDILLETIRKEIAACVEKAYTKISFQEGARLLFLSSLPEVKAFAKERGWELGSDNCFQFQEEKKTDDAIPSYELALQAIDYAKELEMIV